MGPCQAVGRVLLPFGECDGHVHRATFAIVVVYECHREHHGSRAEEVRVELRSSGCSMREQLLAQWTLP